MAAALAAVAGCGSVGPARPPGGPGATPAVVLTEADSGRTVPLSVGEQAALRLSSSHTWSEPQVSGGAVRLAAAAGPSAAGYREWTITAVARGAATVTAAGRPSCPPGAICPGAILAFTVTLDVT